MPAGSPHSSRGCHKHWVDVEHREIVSRRDVGGATLDPGLPYRAVYGPLSMTAATTRAYVATGAIKDQAQGLDSQAFLGFSFDRDRARQACFADSGAHGSGRLVDRRRGLVAAERVGIPQDGR
jgi:hypothetical protein